MCARVSFLIKLQAEACNFIKKETLAQLFSCEFYKISKNTFSYRASPVAASEQTKFVLKTSPSLITLTLKKTRACPANASHCTFDVFGKIRSI